MTPDEGQVCEACAFFRAYTSGYRRRDYGRCMWRFSLVLPVAVSKVAMRAVKRTEGKNCGAFISMRALANALNEEPKGQP